MNADITEESVAIVASKLQRKICKTLDGEWATAAQMRSIAQHHFQELFVGNGSDGGIYYGTKARKKIAREVLEKAFDGNTLPDIVVLEPDGGEGKEAGSRRKATHQEKKIQDPLLQLQGKWTATHLHRGPSKKQREDLTGGVSFGG